MIGKINAAGKRVILVVTPVQESCLHAFPHFEAHRPEHPAASGRPAASSEPPSSAPLSWAPASTAPKSGSPTVESTTPASDNGIASRGVNTRPSRSTDPEQAARPADSATSGPHRAELKGPAVLEERTRRRRPLEARETPGEDPVPSAASCR